MHSGTPFAGSPFAPPKGRERIFMLTLTLIPLAAAGWSLLYLLFGGGLGGAILIFIVLKMLGR